MEERGEGGVPVGGDGEFAEFDAVLGGAVLQGEAVFAHGVAVGVADFRGVGGVGAVGFEVAEKCEAA